MKLVFSIVSHGQAPLVQKLLNSIDLYLISRKHEVLVVVTENLGSDYIFKSSAYEVRQILNLRQKGFGANHNSVFERFDCDFFFVVNPDILFFQVFDLDLLVDEMVCNKIDLASPCIFNSQGVVEDYKRADLTFLNLFKRKFFRSYQEKFDWFAGMFLIVRSNSFSMLNGFDTDFFMYVEDCDFGMRARSHGVNVKDIDGFSVIHDARRSSFKKFKHLKWHIVSLLRYWFFK